MFPSWDDSSTHQPSRIKGNKWVSPTFQVIKYEYKFITFFVDFIRWVKVKYSQKRMVNVKFIFYTVCIKLTYYKL